MIDRRHFLSGAGSLATLAALASSAPALAEGPPAGLAFEEAGPFSFETLIARARERAGRPYAPPERPEPEVLERIDYDAHRQLLFRNEHALWRHGPGEFPVTFFHLGRLFQKPVQIFVIEGGVARRIIYDQRNFQVPPDSPARELPPGAGFAGFRFQERRGSPPDRQFNDWVAFLGASYFRAVAEPGFYGISARGIAIDTALPDRGEEFPDFVEFHIETPAPGLDSVTVHALLDGPSITGAYRFDIRRTEAVVIDIEKHLFMRRDVARLGIAPLTSMYWFSETAKPTAVDWRPEVHDSDGVALWTGAGERLWRPLNNPSRLAVSAFSDADPRGFGLMQRDRDYGNYLDGARYETRPSLWIEPHGSWGQGSVQLVEIPTADEYHDNIVAMWVPAVPARTGDAFTFRYRTHWALEQPDPPDLARVVATRLGLGDDRGERPRLRRFSVEFEGGPLAGEGPDARPEPAFWASRGELSGARVDKLATGRPGHWRAEFSLDVRGTEPVELRAYLNRGGHPVTEVWTYQYHPS